MAGVRENLDYVAVAQPYFNGTMRPLTLAPGAGIPDMGVDCVSKIDGRGAARQNDHLALRGEL